MKKYVCKKKCFINNRLWVPGELLALEDGQEAPKFFIPQDTSKKMKAHEKSTQEVATFAEMQRQEARETLASVGHKEVEEKKEAKVEEKKKEEKEEDFLK